jgi:phenylalanyl-tRNA synthetase beta chain
VDVATAKGLLEQLTARLTWCRLRYETLTPRDGVEHPGRVAAVYAVEPSGDSAPIGRVGELHPALLERFGVRADHVVFAEIDLDAIGRLVPARLRVGELEHLPGVERDIAVVVDADRAAGEVEGLIREHGGPQLRSVRLFDQYRGAPLDEGQKSLAYRLRFESVDGVFHEEMVESAVEQVVAVLYARLGARLRA